jgi:hypothetical protein
MYVNLVLSDSLKIFSTLHEAHEHWNLRTEYSAIRTENEIDVLKLIQFILIIKYDSDYRLNEWSGIFLISHQVKQTGGPIHSHIFKYAGLSPG